MVFLKGKKASEVIKELEKLIEEHGDRECFISSGDYPEGVDGVYFNTRKSDGYIPNSVFVIWG